MLNYRLQLPKVMNFTLSEDTPQEICLAYCRFTVNASAVNFHFLNSKMEEIMSLSTLTFTRGSGISYIKA